MKPIWFFLAIASGKFIRFMTWSILVILYGRTIIETTARALREHHALVMTIGGSVIVLIAVYVIRKLFDRSRVAHASPPKKTPPPPAPSPEEPPSKPDPRRSLVRLRHRRLPIIRRRLRRIQPRPCDLLVSKTLAPHAKAG